MDKGKPIYTFYCRDCGKTFESELEYEKNCSHCGSNNIIPIEGE